MGTPRVSILIMAYNRKIFLQEAVNSALGQTAPGDQFEVVVIKNFDHREIDDMAKEGLISTVMCEEPSLGKFINEGVKHCSGEMIALLDDDDMWENTKVERIVRFMDENQNVGYYHNTVQPILESGEHNDKGRNFESQPTSKWQNPQIINHSSKRRAIKYLGKFFPDFNMSSIAVHSQILRDNAESLCSVHAGTDTFLFLMALASQKDLVIDPLSLTLYRQHSQNVSGGNSKNDMEYLESMYKFTSDVDTAYKNMYDYTLKFSQKYLRRFAKRRIVFTGVLNSIQSPKISRLRTFLKMSSLLPYIGVFNPGLNIKALGLSVMYIFSPKFSRYLLARNM